MMRNKRAHRLGVAAVALCLASLAWATRFDMGMSNAIRHKTKELDRKAVGREVAALISYLEGVAAHGDPIAFAPVTLRDCAGRMVLGRTDGSGKFSIADTGLAYPIMLRVPFGGTNFHSIAYEAGTINLTPFTDMVLRAYNRSASGVIDMDARFEADFKSLCPLPVGDDLAPGVESTIAILVPPLVREGIDPGSYDIFKDPFDADGTGKDRIIKDVKITSDTAGGTVTMTDGATNSELGTLQPPLDDNSVPGPPTGLAADSDGDSVSLRWTASTSPVSGYEIYADDEAVGFSTTTFFTDVDPGVAVSALTGSASLTNQCRGICGCACFPSRRKRLPPGPHRYCMRSVGSNGKKAQCGFTIVAAVKGTLTVNKVNLNQNANGTVTCAPQGGGLPVSLGLGQSTAKGAYPLGTAINCTAQKEGASFFGGWSGSGCSATGGATLTASVPKVTCIAKFTTTPPPTFTPLCPPSAPCSCELGADCNPALVDSPTGGNGVPYFFSQNGLTPPDTGVNETNGNLGGRVGVNADPRTYTFQVCIKDTLGLSTCQDEAVVVGASGLTVALAGTGGGTVTSGDSRIDCGAKCSANYGTGASVILTAQEDSDSDFVGWFGADCSGTNHQCAVAMSASKTVTARFDPKVKTSVYVASISGTLGTCSDSSCSFRIDYSGNFNLTLSQNADGSMTGSADVPLIENFTVVSACGGCNCRPGHLNFDSIGPVSGATASNFSGTLTQSVPRPFTLSFNGSLSGTTVTGSGTINKTTRAFNDNGSFTDCPHSVSYNVNLAKQSGTLAVRPAAAAVAPMSKGGSPSP